MPRALITGVSGFVGGHLARHLLESGDEVLGTSPDGAWMETSPEDLRDRVELVAWDFLKAKLPEGDARARIESFRPEAIYHLAAISVPGQCGRTRPTYRAGVVNVVGTHLAVKLAEELPGRPRLLFVSTSHVYAPVSPDAPVVDEDAPLGPTTGYGQTKLQAEAAAAEGVARGLDAVVVRAFQHTGPGQGPEMMLPQWASQFAQGGDKPIEIFTRDALIDLCDVRDVVRAYRLLMVSGRGGQTYNIGSGQARRSGDVLEILRRLADPAREIVELHPGPKQDPIADIRRLVRDTGWRAMITLEQTVADTWEWWKQRSGGQRAEGRG